MSKITWHVKQEEIFQPKEEYHAGTFRKDESVEIDLQVWNNRWGVVDSENIKAPVLNFYFNDYEDSSLINLCEVVVEGEKLPVLKKGNKGTTLLPRELSGKANDGDEGSGVNAYNFINISFKVVTSGKRLKENDLKEIYFEITELS